LVAGIGSDIMSSPSPAKLWMNSSGRRQCEAGVPARSTWLCRVKVYRAIPPQFAANRLGGGEYRGVNRIMLHSLIP
jgi:hypothetical protein